MEQTEDTKSCVVIGAGIAGLMAARLLQEQGIGVTILDKGRGVGGRMATRRIGKAVFDHGAQFFTARDPGFQTLISLWRTAGVAAEWCRGFATQEGSIQEDGHPRYRGAPGMTAVPKYLARGLQVFLEHRVVSIEAQGTQWTVRTDNGTICTADALLLTAPVPQSVAMLNAGGTTLLPNARADLEKICYDPCIALMVQPEESCLPAPGGMQLSGEPISWIGDNHQKGISPCPAVTIHAGPEFSRTHWASEESALVPVLLSMASSWLSEPITDIQVHRWRYAKPTVLHPDACLSFSYPLPLAFAGDAFGAPRVEGAALSGLAAAQALLNLLQNSGPQERSILPAAPS